jgi:hypothetical protein
MAKDPKKRQRGSIEGPFAWRLVEMLESPAYRVLSLSAHRIIARLEIEMAHHGGKPEENGRLPCTYEHFAEFGLHRHAIAPAIRELVSLGFIEITQQGCAGNAGYRQPTLYRLTYRHWGSHKETTDEWRRVKTIEEAEAIAERARSAQPGRAPKIKVQCRKPSPAPVPETITERNHSPVPETITTGPVPETITTSISPGVGPLSDRGDDPTPLSLATPLADGAPTPGDVLHPNAPTTLATTRPRLVWTQPVVRELTGAEAGMRRDEICVADPKAQVADLMRLATVH